MNRRTTIHAAQPASLQSLTHLAGGLRRSVASRLMREFGVRLTPPLIRRVLDEASEVAQETGFPNLFFPALAEEKARFVATSISTHRFETTSRTLSNAA